ncbi:CRISPR-associated protein Csx19 [Selenomonas sputigena]|uniref:type III-D CRISPR-associated protein Csx19 n=1 Tax=Selenomonas sputigena TaxID=69823 RepID=UPI002234AFC5|nr:CRISPR-associated protein Csx19 [Selenomonas sputigena]UZE45743.1 CRISPR-associated protein Csx19 [Selenomonas sputigena]
MSIELALEDQMCIQQGSSERLAVSLARKEAALCEKLEVLGMKEANVVVWQVHGITWGRWQNGSLKLAGDAAKKCSLWLELRVFNEEEELHLKKSGDMWLGRWRKDGAGEATEYVDSISRFWGERVEAADAPEGYMKLEDAARKLKQILPQAEERAKYYGLVTRSYIGYEATGQAGYADYRYVRIAAADVEGGMEDGNAR